MIESELITNPGHRMGTLSLYTLNAESGLIPHPVPWERPRPPSGVELIDGKLHLWANDTYWPTVPSLIESMEVYVISFAVELTDEVVKVFTTKTIPVVLIHSRGYTDADYLLRAVPHKGSPKTPRTVYNRHGKDPLSVFALWDLSAYYQGDKHRIRLIDGDEPYAVVNTEDRVYRVAQPILPTPEMPIHYQPAAFMELNVTLK